MGEVVALNVHLWKLRDEIGKRLSFIRKPDFDLSQAVASRTVEEVYSFGERGAGYPDGEDVDVPVGAMVQLFCSEKVDEALSRKLETNPGDLGRKQLRVGIDMPRRFRGRLSAGQRRSEQHSHTQQCEKQAAHDVRFASPRMVPVVCYTGMPTENHAGGSVRGQALDWINSG